MAIDQNEYAGIHTVAVISAVGDSFNFEQEGLPVFFSGSGNPPLEISSWGIDLWVKQKVADALSSRFTVTPVDIDTIALRRCTAPAQCAQALPPRTGIDAYVLVYKAWTPNPITGHGDISGLGLLYHKGLFGVGDIYAIHSIYGVAVIDARTGEVIDHGTGRTDTTDFFGTHSDPVEVAKATLWPAHPPEMTAEQQTEAKQIIIQQIDKTLMHALKNAKLIPGSD
jgi:hypothetical protein